MTDSEPLRAVAPVTLEQHARVLERAGRRLFQAPSGAWWYRNERFALTRFPGHRPGPLDGADRGPLFRSSRAALLDWIEPVSDLRPGNALLYTCEGPDYRLEALDTNARRDARRALRELAFRMVPVGELLTLGPPVFADCRRRNGLDDGGDQAFRDRFAGMVPEAGYAFLGAFREGRLAAFLSLLWVDDWVSIGPYAHGAFRQSCPTDGLVHLALAHFLQARGVRVLSYGLSSLQERGSRQGLHAFKTKVGFRAQPVRRCFALHPLLAPLAAGWPRRGLQALLRRFPASRACRKTDGVLGLLDAACGAGDGDKGLNRPGRQA